jgi:hypothetical protein
MEEIKMDKNKIINKIIDDLPTKDMRGEMAKDEWFGWFLEAFDEGIKYEQERVKNLNIPTVISMFNKCDCGGELIQISRNNQQCNKCFTNHPNI